jgi:hypothetical protein
VRPSTANAIAPEQVRFSEVTEAAGVNYTHANAVGENLLQFGSGGVAAGDYDGDGWVDLFAVAGDVGADRLFRNQGDGRFVEVGVEAGVSQSGRRSSGPTFADYDGDGCLDLFVGAVDNVEPALFRNRCDGSFEAQAGMFPASPYVSSTFGDYDGDGDLDLLVSRWGIVPAVHQVDYLWRNEGGTFSGVTSEAQLRFRTQVMNRLEIEWTLSPNFADINNDGLQDVLLASDFGTSQVFLNNGNGTFTDVTDAAITDENGMGTAIADYDADGDLDWFVTSIFDSGGIPTPSWGTTGNRLYRNRGDGTFDDVTETAGVRDGNWGWATCFADFDNDGSLDLFHVNGWPLSGLFSDKPARLFMSNGDGTFREQAEVAGIADRGFGVGIACFDYDRDGDVDVFIANNDGPARLFRNENGNEGSFLQVRLRGRSPNTQGIGARIYATSDSRTQMQELRAGTNYVSQDPAEAHFGLGAAITIDEIRVVWPDRFVWSVQRFVANRMLIVDRDPGDSNCDQRATAADLSRSVSTLATTIPVGCLFADSNGDGTMDASDLIQTAELLFGDG